METDAKSGTDSHRTIVSLDSLVAHLGPQLTQTAAEISARSGYQQGRA